MSSPTEPNNAKRVEKENLADQNNEDESKVGLLEIVCIKEEYDLETDDNPLTFEECSHLDLKRSLSGEVINNRSHTPPHPRTEENMQFKIIETIEKGQKKLSIIPSSWEARNVLRWPRKSMNTNKIMNDNSVNNWSTSNCIVRRRSLTYEEAITELDLMLQRGGPEDNATEITNAIDNNINFNDLADQFDSVSSSWQECKAEANTSYHSINILAEEATDSSILCPVCNKQFISLGNLRRHLPMHDKPTISCGICNKTFKDMKYYEEHKLKHLEQRLYECEICKKTYKTNSHLVQHMRAHEKLFECNLCGHRFSAKHNLVNHIEKSLCTKQKPLIQCKICLKTFKQEWLLKSHLVRHETEKPFQCDICKMFLKTKNSLIRHIQTHTGGTPYSCKFCGKKFSRYSLVRTHLRIHIGEKPYKCPICDRSFSEKHTMQRHVTGHGKVKFLTCDICQKKFKKESRLKYHMRTHTGEKPFTCDLCGRCYSHKSNIKQHYRQKHPGKEFICDETDATFASKIWNRIQKQPESIVHSEEILS